MNIIKYFKTSSLYAGLISLLLLMHSCKDNVINELTEIPYARNFSVSKVVTTAGQTSVDIKWSKSLHASSKTTYTVEVSQDQTFADGTEKAFQADENNITLSDDDIEVLKDYYARVRANAEEDKGESNWEYSDKFQLTGAQYLKEIKYEDIYSEQVTISWDASKEVTHLTLNGNRIDLIPSDILAGKKVISGLTPATNYTIVIYNGAVFKGERTFTTRLGIPAGNARYIKAGDHLRDSIQSAKDGDIFILAQGSVFSFPVINIPNNVSITIYGEEGPNKPQIKTTSSNVFSLPAIAGTLKFQNIAFEDEKNYVINQSVACVVDSIVFENCSIKGYSYCAVRLQSTTAKTIKNLIFNNCLVGNLTPSLNYAFVHTVEENCLIDNISITNSTFYNIGIGLISHTGANSTTLLVDNCTVYDINKGDNNLRYLITYGTKSVATATIKNTIFAKTKSSNASGILMEGGYTSSNNYRTADYVIARGQIQGLIDYNGTSESLFVDPANANFTIKDLGFAGKSTVGDPRWR